MNLKIKVNLPFYFLFFFFTAVSARSQPNRPCDVLLQDNHPCVAAYSTTRALFREYNGPLYRVVRKHDHKFTDVTSLSEKGYANTSIQDELCKNASCLIEIIYDQTSNHNDLKIEGPGGYGGQNVGVDATAFPVIVYGHKVYGAYFSSGMGYRNNKTKNVATGGAPESIYIVASGTHYNDQCCFDFGNVEAENFDHGSGSMDAITVTSTCFFGKCIGKGPWVQADLENGLFQSSDGPPIASEDLSVDREFITAILWNDGQKRFGLKSANAQEGSLKTIYTGSLPQKIPGYIPMRQEGGIVLGTGGDDSNKGIGTFFEGAITNGIPSEESFKEIQNNIVMSRYRIK